MEIGFLIFMVAILGFEMAISIKARDGYEHDKRINEQLRAEIRAGLTQLAEKNSAKPKLRKVSRKRPR
jgi:hypothetical protein